MFYVLVTLVNSFRIVGPLLGLQKLRSKMGNNKMLVVIFYEGNKLLIDINALILRKCMI